MGPCVKQGGRQSPHQRLQTYGTSSLAFGFELRGFGFGLLFAVFGGQVLSLLWRDVGSFRYFQRLFVRQLGMLSNEPRSN